jgi:hypothetical protein
MSTAVGGVEVLEIVIYVDAIQAKVANIPVSQEKSAVEWRRCGRSIWRQRAGDMVVTVEDKAEYNDSQ